MAATEITLKVVNAIGEVPADAWDACANPPASAASGDGSMGGYNPFISHDYLSSLELSGSVRNRAGWQPMHLVAEAGSTVVGVVPCYAKSHSQGEYVFDHGWADAYERAGGDYYPKLQVAVPFTPAQGRRLLVRPGEHADAVRNALADSLADICKRSNASSVHVTFLTEHEWRMLGSRNYLQRTHRQFHWTNEGYASFDAFLTALSSRKRKTIRRERDDALANGITIDWLTGSDLTESVWDTFFEFYMDTGSRKWGRPYLTRSFYSLVGEKMRDKILLVMAKRNGRYIAGAINFIGSDTLFGRHWGCLEQHAFLHFEVCYYQAMQFAIERKLSRVEAGAGGSHKVTRGYMPTTTYSAHYIADPRLRRAIDDFLSHERVHVQAEIEEYAEAAPFRKGS
jgi:predicted N-acyltransferase